MDLILWRHCDAEAGAPDESRRLSPLGLKQAARMAHWLVGRLPTRCRIVVSPALRAQQTAHALKRSFETLTELAPGATVPAALGAVRWPDAGEPVLLVGHQPALGRIASYLICGEACDWTIRAGGLWWLSKRPRDEGAPVVLEVAITPDYV